MPLLPWTESIGNANQSGFVRPYQEIVEGETVDLSAVVVASRLVLRTRRDAPRFFSASLSIRRQVLYSSGALGVSLIGSPSRRIFWILSAWWDQSAINKFVLCEPHASISARYRENMQAVTFVSWTVPATTLPVRWAEAMSRFAAWPNAGERRQRRFHGWRDA